VTASAQTLHDDGFAPLACIDGTGDTSGQRARDGAARRVRIVIGGPEKGTGAGTEDSRAGGLMIEVALIAGKRLAGGKVALEGRCGRAVEDRSVVRTASGAGSQKDRKEAE
jgi:hypothetical protein